MPPLNYWAILISAVLSVPLGFLWYGPLFGKKWMTLSGIVMPAERPGMSVMLKPMLLSLVGAVLMNFALASLIVFHSAYYQVAGYGAALALAFFLWLAFIVPPYLNLSGWEHKPWALFWINTLYWLAYLLIAAAVIVCVG